MYHCRFTLCPRYYTSYVSLHIHAFYTLLCIHVMTWWLSVTIIYRLFLYSLPGTLANKFVEGSHLGWTYVPNTEWYDRIFLSGKLLSYMDEWVNTNSTIKRWCQNGLDYFWKTTGFSSMKSDLPHQETRYYGSVIWQNFAFKLTWAKWARRVMSSQFVRPASVVCRQSLTFSFVTL